MRLNFDNIMIDCHKVVWLFCDQRYFVLYLNRVMLVSGILIQYTLYNFIVLFMNDFCCKIHCCKIKSRRMLESRCEKIWSIPWLLMLGLIGAQGREQLWFCICLANGSLASMSKYVKYLCHHSVEKWWKMLIYFCFLKIMDGVKG